MAEHPTCPRCRGPLRGDRCADHGEVAPLLPFGPPSAELLTALAAASRIPYWLPWPLPDEWIVTGAGRAATPEGVRATVVACSGPTPLSGAGELLVVAEEIGVGLGAGYAGLEGPDPGPAIGSGARDAHVQTEGHPTPLWYVPSPPDRAVYAGEAAGRWLWLVCFPDTTGALLAEPLTLADVRFLGHEVDMVPFGSLAQRLR